MRLYLSSYQLGDAPQHLVDLIRTQPAHGLVIMNALDAGDADRRRSDLARQVAQLADLGLRGRECDLRDHDLASVTAALADSDFVWVRGGDVFVLRMAMARSGFDKAVCAALRRDDLVYAGFSAGPCVLAPSLAGLEWCDPIEPCQRLYGEVSFTGLGILDRPVVPHLDSPGHPETDLLGEVADRYRAQGQEFWALRDGQALVIDGDRTQVVGRA